MSAALPLPAPLFQEVMKEMLPQVWDEEPMLTATFRPFEATSRMSAPPMRQRYSGLSLGSR